MERARDAAAFLRAVAPAILLPRADAEFMTLELAAAAAARCSPEDEDAGDFVVVHQGGKLVLGALRVPISAQPGVLRLCGDPENGATMLAAMQLAEMAASDQGMFPKMTGVSGPAVLSEAFARHLCFKRRAREPEGGDDAPRPQGEEVVWSFREGPRSRGPA